MKKLLRSGSPGNPRDRRNPHRRRIILFMKSMPHSSPLPLQPMLLTALLAGLTAAMALLRIPLPWTPVPVTGQTLAVILAGALLGPRWGALSQAIYVAMGLAGLPVFAGGQAGLPAVLGPTGGYIWGFPAGAWVVGRLLPPRQAPGWARAFLASLAGGVGVVYLLGVPWLALEAGLGLKQALIAGAVPFLPGDLLKCLAASAILPRLCRILHPFRSAGCTEEGG